ncbi:helix-turn-helix domain-containing protein [Enterococcus raffinosus]|uniref:helix-turn-helix domain-containing protein n=1 Tax=Enterococcus raffinosus TaxID=71452 RepID=UPI00288D7BDB|nr:helix-turn-helix domain-containing protein [Enterococcus raffinosus]MDT2554670.1 helix-turn-helix domain-containing protein [Enterococcus raffinosus]
MTILLLTKSLSFEQNFVRELNSLGHEVLCSKRFLVDLQQKDYFGMDLNYFETVILSETISDQEVRTILPFFRNFSCVIYRKTSVQMSDEILNQWKYLGIMGFISQNTCFDELREELVICNQNRTLLKWDTTNNEDEALERLVRNFSKQELQVFHILQDSHKTFVSREFFSQELWGGPQTKSKESRLSGIIRSIKKKLSDCGFDETCLETSWGRGYRLEALKFKQIRVEIHEDNQVVES